MQIQATEFKKLLKEHSPVIKKTDFKRYVKQAFKPASPISEEEMLRMTTKMSS